MEHMGFHGNKKKCAAAHVKKGCLARSERMKTGPAEVIECWKVETHNKFLGALENIRQKDNLKLGCAENVYQQRISVKNR